MPGLLEHPGVAELHGVSLPHDEVVGHLGGGGGEDDDDDEEEEEQEEEEQ